MRPLRVRYTLAAPDRAEARRRALALALENTAELPLELVPPSLRDSIPGRVESLEPAGPGRFRAVIAYGEAVLGPGITQLLGVTVGNGSFLPGVRCEEIDPGDAGGFPGPRHGIGGVRARAGRPRGGLIAPVVKPVGLGLAELTALAEDFARAGADIVKEDQGLAWQGAAPFPDRVAAIAAALDRAADSTGRRPLHLASLNVPAGEIDRCLEIAERHRVDGLVLMPGILGFAMLERLARDPAHGFILLAHPSFLGGLVATDEAGIAPAALFGRIMRLAGADISIFPSPAGRFALPAEDARAVAQACRAPDFPARPCLPAPGGGLHPGNAGALRALLGDDVVYILGGSVLARRDALPETFAAMRAALDGDRP